LSQLNLDGTYVIANKGGQSIANQDRKKAQTTNLWAITGSFIIVSLSLVTGNHHKTYNLRAAFNFIKGLAF